MVSRWCKRDFIATGFLDCSTIHVSLPDSSESHPPHQKPLSLAMNFKPLAALLTFACGSSFGDAASALPFQLSNAQAQPATTQTNEVACTYREDVADKCVVTRAHVKRVLNDAGSIEVKIYGNIAEFMTELPEVRGQPRKRSIAQCRFEFTRSVTDGALVSPMCNGRTIKLQPASGTNWSDIAIGAKPCTDIVHSVN